MDSNNKLELDSSKRFKQLDLFFSEKENGDGDFHYYVRFDTTFETGILNKQETRDKIVEILNKVLVEMNR